MRIAAWHVLDIVFYGIFSGLFEIQLNKPFPSNSPSVEFTSLSLPGISNQNIESRPESLNNNIDPSTTSPEICFQSTTDRLNERKLQRRFSTCFKRPNNTPTQMEQHKEEERNTSTSPTRCPPFFCNRSARESIACLNLKL